MILQSHFAARGYYTTRPSRSVCAAAKGVPRTRPVRPARPTAAAPASCKAICGNGTVGMQGPDAHWSLHANGSMAACGFAAGAASVGRTGRTGRVVGTRFAALTL